MQFTDRLIKSRYFRTVKFISKKLKRLLLEVYPLIRWACIMRDPTSMGFDWFVDWFDADLNNFVRILDNQYN